MKYIFNKFNKIPRYFVASLVGVLSACVFNLCFGSDDPLQEVLKPQIKGMFGPGSTVSYCVYVAEIIGGAVAYSKTKNLMLLAGTPILVVFTSAMFSYISRT